MYLDDCVCVLPDLTWLPLLGVGRKSWYIIKKLIITHQEPIEGIKVGILLGYLCNILGYPSKYCNYTSKKKLGRFLHSPCPPQWIIFLIVISQKILLNIKDVEFDFRIGCILVLFPLLWIINVQFTNFGFLDFQFFIFKISDIGLLWSKITIFIIEISLKLHLHTKYGWNNPNSCRLSLKSPNFIFCHFRQLKNSSHTQTFKYMSSAQFS